MSDDAGEFSEARTTRRRVLEALAALAVAATGLPAASAAASSGASPSTHTPGAARSASASPSASSASPSASPGAHALTASSLVVAAASLDGASLLDDALGQPFLDGLTASVGEDALTRLVALVQSTPAAELDGALRSADLTSAAEAVVAAFYSGLVGAPGKETVVTYLMALVWGAAPFTKPPSICGGMFGYWAKPPAEAPGASSGA